MPVDYQKIREDNRNDWSEKSISFVRDLLTRLYSDRTHFISEILQNANDALGKRGQWDGERSVSLSLDSDGLTVSHFGKPFDGNDVLGICSFGESTKLEDLTSIGQFGIGFKSVYAFTDTPEIHSGDEHFLIESCVFPQGIGKRCLEPEETQIIIPFDKDLGEGESAKDAVLKGLQAMATRTLLFLREIEEIAWSVDGGPAKRHRSIPSKMSSHHALNVRQVRLVGPGDDLAGGEQWIVFSRPVEKDEKPAGFVEIAFLLEHSDAGSQNLSVCSVADSKLFVFFPTELKTNLGFLMHGPYSTTPSRENINHPDSWNQYLARETAVLLVEALRELRGLGWLNAAALQTLPLKIEADFAEGGQLAPMFQAVKNALLNEPLLPAHNGGHIAGKNAKLGTELLRGLITPEQLAELLQTKAALGWINADVTLGNAPDLYNYLLKDDEDGLGIDELDARWLIGKLTPEFMVLQTDDWVEKLYKGLRRLGAREELKKTPLLRLQQDDPHKDALHTTAVDDNGNLQVYLPKSDGSRTGFATIKAGVCKSDEALAFLKGLDLREPDPVDDVIKNILTKYDQEAVDIPDQEYQSDIKQIVKALATDSTSQHDNLVSHLRKTKFVFAVEAGTGESRFVTPREAYIPTERLRSLFEGVNGVLLVDNSRDCLRGEQIRSLLRAVGTPEYLVQIRIESSLTEEKKREYRRQQEDTRWFGNKEAVEDYTLRDLDPLLTHMASLPSDLASERAELLWEALRDVHNRSNQAFYGSYRWVYYGPRSQRFSARFVKTLKEFAWVPDKDGKLSRPSEVVFQDTGWEKDPALEAEIKFKSAVIEELAKKAGIEPGALDFMRKRGITEADLRKKFGIKDENGPSPTDNGRNTGDQDDRDPDPPPNRGRTRGRGPDVDKPRKVEQQPKLSISITLRTSSDGSNGDGSGDRNPRNKEVEDAAIKLILTEDASLRRTKDGNHGFDLWEPGLNDKPVQLNEAEDERELKWELGPNDQPKRWIEVKSGAGALPSVALSITQFKVAWTKWDAYWLYVVENATTEGASRISKIRNPAKRILDTIDGFNLSSAWIGEHQSRDNPEE